MCSLQSLQLAPEKSRQCSIQTETPRLRQKTGGSAVQDCLNKGTLLSLASTCLVTGVIGSASTYSFRTHLRLFPQAEYVDTSTLETRLQNVARRMVSTNPRRSDSERPPTSVPLQNGFLPGESPGSSYGATTSGRGFGSGSNLGSSGLNAPQDALLPSASTGMPHASGGGSGMPGAGGNHFMQHPGMPMHSAPGMSSSRMLQGQVSDSGMGMGMLGSGQVKPDPGPSGGIGMGGMGSYPMNSGHSNFIRNQNPPGPGPVMSNGAPVLLRSSREWTPGQTSNVINVRSILSVSLTGSHRGP